MTIPYSQRKSYFQTYYRNKKTNPQEIIASLKGTPTFQQAFSLILLI